MFLNGYLQFPEGRTPAVTLFIDGTSAQFADFVLQPAARHSGAPSAKRASHQMPLRVRVLVILPIVAEAAIVRVLVETEFA